MSKENSGRQRLTSIVATVIFIAWVVNFILDITVETHDPPGYLQPLMLIVAGWLFTDSVLPRRKNGNG